VLSPGGYRVPVFNHCNIEKEFKRVVHRWKDKGYELDIGEFCLMLIVQTLCLAGVVVKGHKDLYNLVYPVHNLGMAKQLEHIGNSDQPGMLHYLSAETGLPLKAIYVNRQRIEFAESKITL
jgi:hypothetical protein